MMAAAITSQTDERTGSNSWSALATLATLGVLALASRKDEVCHA